MRTRLFLLSSAMLFLAGCASTPAARIERQRAVFDAYPAETQAKIRAGEVELGFDQAMVRLALGQPDRKSTKTTQGGESELWIYERGGARFSFGLGLGSSGRHSGIGAGVGVSSGGLRREQAKVIEFRQGRVVQIDYLTDFR